MHDAQEGPDVPPGDGAAGPEDGVLVLRGGADGAAKVDEQEVREGAAGGEVQHDVVQVQVLVEDRVLGCRVHELQRLERLLEDVQGQAEREGRAGLLAPGEEGEEGAAVTKIPVRDLLGEDGGRGGGGEELGIRTSWPFLAATASNREAIRTSRSNSWAAVSAPAAERGSQRTLRTHMPPVVALCTSWVQHAWPEERVRTKIMWSFGESAKSCPYMQPLVSMGEDMTGQEFGR